MVIEGRVFSDDLKHFNNAICCETYGDVAKFKQELPELEKSFPQYREGCSAKWGKHTLGRIPPFRVAGRQETANHQ